jgi:hypothetical protein
VPRGSSVSEREHSADALGSSEDTSEEKGKRPYSDLELSEMLNFIDFGVAFGLRHGPRSRSGVMSW